MFSFNNLCIVKRGVCIRDSLWRESVHRSELSLRARHRFRVLLLAAPRAQGRLQPLGLRARSESSRPLHGLLRLALAGQRRADHGRVLAPPARRVAGAQPGARAGKRHAQPRSRPVKTTKSVLVLQSLRHLLDHLNRRHFRLLHQIVAAASALKILFPVK
jgi:hypothetical protein